MPRQVVANRPVPPFADNPIDFLLDPVLQKVEVLRRQGTNTSIRAFLRQVRQIGLRGRPVKEGVVYAFGAASRAGFRELTPGREERLLLVVGVGGGQEPMLLLTNLAGARDSQTLGWIVRIYLTRWKMEETFRSVSS